LVFKFPLLIATGEGSEASEYLKTYLPPYIGEGDEGDEGDFQTRETSRRGKLPDEGDFQTRETKETYRE
jgi:hypothetical protein